MVPRDVRRKTPPQAKRKYHVTPSAYHHVDINLGQWVNNALVLCTIGFGVLSSGKRGALPLALAYMLEALAMLVWSSTFHWRRVVGLDKRRPFQQQSGLYALAAGVAVLIVWSVGFAFVHYADV